MSISSNKFIDYLKCGHSCKETAIKFSICESSITYALKKNKINYHEDIKYGHLPKHLTDYQKEVLIGNLLGDGHIGKNGQYRFLQKKANIQYVTWLHDIFKPFSNDIKQCKNGHQYQAVYFSTPCVEIFKKLRAKWYPDGKKELPTDLKITPLTIAIWLCDDGSNHQQRKQINFSTESFSKDDVLKLINLLANYGIKSAIQRNRSGHIIRVSKKSYWALIDLVKPHIPCECMNYKADTLKVPIRTYKVTKEVCDKIFELKHNNLTTKAIGSIVNLDHGVVCNIINGKYKNKILGDQYGY